jgi:hypothetical protein
VKGHDKKNLESGVFVKRNIEEAVKITMRMQTPVILESENNKNST